MSLSAFFAYIQSFSSQIPLRHWCVIAIASLLVTLLTRKKFQRYGAIVLGITVFCGLYLLDAAVLLRYLGYFPHGASRVLKIDLDWLGPVREDRRIEIITNLIAFSPVGFFLVEFFSATKQFNPWRSIGYVALAGLCFSLCIESLQILLRVGVFDLTDLLMNTIGTFVGGSLAQAVRRLCYRYKSRNNRQTTVI